MEESLNRFSVIPRSPLLCASASTLFEETPALSQTPQQYQVGSPHSSARAWNGICQSAGGGTKLAGKSCVPLLSKVRRNASRILRLSSPPDPIRRARSTKSFTLLFAAFRGSV